jgi:hypothetical protein
MKRLAMILAVAFTMGLATSTVMAAPKDKKAKTECCSKDKKACTSEKKAETPAPKN